jgi:GNAT superfamily N-acetyltransferase
MALLIPEAPAAHPPPRVQPQLRRAVEADREDLIRFVADLSPSSGQHRFLTGIGGRVPRAVLEQLLHGGRGGGALVAVMAGRLVGHALWARASGRDEPVAEIAMVVADAYQRQGIGSLLLDELRVQMVCDGIRRVQVVTGAANRPVLGMLSKNRPGVRPTERDGAVLTYDFAVTP